ncbi:MAG TPA: TrmB family transcriptional regulator [Candidatus Scybalocola faecavium]|nr:TrmB family transcriptional regulator [Candidatus Scybalocola faecavium]
MDVVEGLMRFGLTRQESMIYIHLLSGGAMTGYEAAKATGISRSNTYTALAALTDKGAACTADGTPTRYMAVSGEEFLENKIRSLERLKDFLVEQLPGKVQEDDAYITIKGEENICDKMDHLIRSARYRIYITGEYERIRPFMALLKGRSDAGLKVVVITDRSLDLPGMITYVSERQKGQIGLITDSLAVITGEIPENGPAACLYSRKKNLVDLFKNSLSNEIKLIELTKGAQDHEESAVCNETTAG